VACWLGNFLKTEYFVLCIVLFGVSYGLLGKIEVRWWLFNVISWFYCSSNWFLALKLGITRNKRVVLVFTRIKNCFSLLLLGGKRMEITVKLLFTLSFSYKWYLFYYSIIFYVTLIGFSVYLRFTLCRVDPGERTWLNHQIHQILTR
jgi:hypothetical protein